MNHMDKNTSLSVSEEFLYILLKNGMNIVSPSIAYRYQRWVVIGPLIMEKIESNTGFPEVQNKIKYIMDQNRIGGAILITRFL